MTSLTRLNLLDSVSIRLDDFVALIKSMHLVAHLAISGDFHLFDLTQRMHSDMVFNESMNRPLEQFRLKWNGSGRMSFEQFRFRLIP